MIIRSFLDDSGLLCSVLYDYDRNILHQYALQLRNSYIVVVLVCPVTAVFMKVTDAQGQGVIPADVTALRGQRVTLNCSGTDVKWSAETKKIFASPDTWSTPRGNKYDITGSYNLVVNDLDPSSDGGKYTCNTNAFSSRLLFANLVVLGNRLI